MFFVFLRLTIIMKNFLSNNIYTNAIRNIRTLLTLEEKKRGGIMLLLLIINALSDVLGLLGIAPVLAVVIDFNNVYESSYLFQFYTYVGSPEEFKFLLLLSFLLLIVFLVKNIIALYIQYLQARYALDISLSLSIKQFQHHYKRGYGFIRSEDSGILVYKITTIPLHFAKFYIVPAFTLTTEILILILIFGAMFFYNTVLMLVVILATLPGFGLIYFFTKTKVKQLGNQRDKVHPVSLLRVLEGMNGYTDVKLSNIEQVTLDDYVSIQDELNGIDALLDGLYKRVHQRSNEVILGLGIIGICTFGLLFPENQENILFILAAFGAVALRVMPSFNRIMTAMLTIKNFSYTVERMKPLQNKYVLTYPIFDKMPFDKKLKVRNLSFQYPNTNLPTLNKIDIEVSKGEMIGVIGTSGSGKTTLLNLILQFLEPNKGTIEVDKVALNEENRGSFQKILGYVKQEVFIKDATLMENIAFDRHNIDEVRVRKAIKDAQLETYLEELPNGLQTMLGENGANLSGGQKQRIGIARALYKDADILLFDEITSALDSETEHAITESISNLAKLNKTVIIVAHRLSTLKYCDRIYELKNGEVVRMVSYEELLD